METMKNNIVKSNHNKTPIDCRESSRRTWKESQNWAGGELGFLLELFHDGDGASVTPERVADIVSVVGAMQSSAPVTKLSVDRTSTTSSTRSERNSETVNM